MDIKNFVPALMMCALIFVISSIPGTTINKISNGNSYYNINGHFLLYFILTFCMYKGTKNIKLSIILTILYGVTDEYHQTFVPNRSWENFDLVVNSIASIFSGLILWKLQPLIPKKLNYWLQN